MIGIFQSTSSIQRKTETRKGTPSRKAFQSTSSIQRKTEIFVFLQVYFFISIHFLYTEEDQGNYIPIESHRYFNPLPLYRGRQPIILSHNTAYLFQSTSSIQRKTLRLDTFKPTFNISIHFLYTEEDFLFGQTAEVIAISIHFLYTEEDGYHCVKALCNPVISIHFLYTEEDAPGERRKNERNYFNPLPLYRGRPKLCGCL